MQRVLPSDATLATVPAADELDAAADESRVVVACAVQRWRASCSSVAASAASAGRQQYGMRRSSPLLTKSILISGSAPSIISISSTATKSLPRSVTTVSPVSASASTNVPAL